VLHFRGLQRTQRAGLDRDQQPERGIQRARVAFGPRPRQEPLRPANRIGRQDRRPLQERGRRGQPSARLGPPRGALKLHRHVLIQNRRGLRQVPRAAIGISRRVDGLGQRAVHLLQVLSRRGPVCRRAHQRMPEPHLGAELDQPRLHRRHSVLNTDPEPPGCPPHQRRVTRRLGRRGQHQQPGIFRQVLDPPPEALLDPPKQRSRAGQSEPARHLRRRKPARQFEQRQRVAARLGHHLVPDPRVQRPRQHRVKQRPRIVGRQALHPELRQAGQFVAGCPRRQHQAHRIGREAAGDKPQGLRRSPVKPMLVIDHADQWPFRGYLRKQAQHGQSDQEPVRCRTGTDAQRDPDRVTLRHRYRLQVIQHRRAQLMQPGERQFHLRLHPGRVHHPAARGQPGQTIQ